MRFRVISCLRCSQRFYGVAASSSVPQVAIVGSGPAGFYTAQQVLKGHPTALVDIYEKLPVPFGLVRYGVAPDHPEVKNVIGTFTQTANSERCRYFGNVDVGRDVSLIQLRQAYTAVVLAYGAADDKMFGIPGEDLNGVMSARSFVGWYNGLPQHRNLAPNLDTDTAVVLGQGNVAVDVARILLSSIDELKKTDITEYAAEALSRSRIKTVHLVGRRGPLQVAFTPAELREMIRLPGCRPVFSRDDFDGIRKHISEIPRSRKRLTELMVKTALDAPSSEDAARWTTASKDWTLTFLQSPLRFLPATSDKSRVGGIQFALNRLEGPIGDGAKAVVTGKTEELPCGLVLRSIGYKSHRLDSDTPFDNAAAVVPNKLGRVEGHPGLYCSGWLKRGPVGVLATTMNDAFETGKILVDDLKASSLSSTLGGSQIILEILRKQGIQVVTFVDWERIDRVELDRGAAKGKLREKIADIGEMLQAASSS